MERASPLLCPADVDGRCCCWMLLLLKELPKLPDLLLLLLLLLIPKQLDLLPVGVALLINVVIHLALCLCRYQITLQ